MVTFSFWELCVAVCVIVDNNCIVQSEDFALQSHTFTFEFYKENTKTRSMHWHLTTVFVSPWGTALLTLHTRSLKFPLTLYLWHKTTHKWHHPALTVISPLSLVKCGQGVCHVTAKLKICQAVRCEVLSKTVHLACWCVYLADVNELVKGITFVSQEGWSCAFQKTLSDWLEFLFDDLNFSMAVWSYFLSCCKFILADSNIFLRGWTCEPYKAH